MSKLTIIVVIAIALYPIQSLAQSRYKQGYYIDDSGVRHEGWIRDTDWRKVPVSFRFKTSTAGDASAIRLDGIQEFSIGGQVFSEYTVDIDQSKDNLQWLSEGKEPQFERKEVFLKQLVKGDVSLLSCYDNDRVHFFYEKEGEIKELIWKRYAPTTNSIRENKTFQTQLITEINCQNYSFDKVQSLKYREEDLVPYFNNHNECAAGYSIADQAREESLIEDSTLPLADRNLPDQEPPSEGKKKDFNFGLKLALLGNSFDNSITEKVNQTDLRFGLGFEFFLPYVNNTISILIEPSFKAFDYNEETDRNIFDLKYNSLEVPFGVRYSLPLSQQFRLFVNGFYVFSHSLNSEYNVTFINDDLSRFRRTFGVASSSGNVSYGLGIEYKKIALEVRNSSKRSFLDQGLGEYQYLAYIIQYSF